MSVVRRLQEATGKNGLWDIVKRAGLSIVLDGNWGESAMQLSGGKKTRLVGEDQLGNKYYEDNTRPYGRHRWVIFKDLNEYHGSQVHAQWHAWLHCISDKTPIDEPPKKHKFDVEYVPSASGEEKQYLPKGSWENQQQRNWLKVEYWTPPSL